MTVPEAMQKALGKVKRRTGPLWQGPEDDGDMGGITQSMIGDFLSCRMRFKLKYLDGLRINPHFNHRLEYGNLWHACEEAHALGKPWGIALGKQAQELRNRYPFAVDQITHWSNVCGVQFPLYVKHWSEHPDMLERTPLMSEQVFKVPYSLPSGRTVWLRGKFDSVDLVQSDLSMAEFGGNPTGVWLQENKAKGDVDEEKLRRQLTFDLQTMLYLVALHIESDADPSGTVYVDRDYSVMMNTLRTHNIVGVRYNVIRRPLSGGKGSIVRRKGKPQATCSQCKGTGMTPKGTKVCSGCSGTKVKPGIAEETEAEFYGRLSEVIAEESGEFFYRWNVRITDKHVAAFKTQFLDPFLEHLCQWYIAVGYSSKPGFAAGRVEVPLDAMTWRHPFGVYNPLDEGGSTDLDEYLATGSEVGLTRIDTLFEELK